MNKSIELEATKIRLRKYAVRPRGQIGTCGSFPKPWSVIYVTASSKSKAVSFVLQSNSEWKK